MSRLEVMAKEYVDVYNYLLKYHEESKNIELDKNGLYVKKDYLVKLLNQNLYETAEEKLQAWRDLSWIITMDGPLDKHQPAGVCDTYTVIRWQAAEEFSPETGVNFGENKTKNNIWDVLTGKPAWLTGFPLFCVQIDNHSVSLLEGLFFLLFVLLFKCFHTNTN